MPPPTVAPKPDVRKPYFMENAAPVAVTPKS
jgi:hypothetical protein